MWRALEAELPAGYAEVVALYQAAAAAGDGLLLASVPSRAPQGEAVATTAPASPASRVSTSPAARARRQRVGFDQELEHGRPDGERLHEVVAVHAAPDEAQLVGDLQAGSVLAVAPGPVPDVLAAGSPIIDTLSVLTDGTYAWPSDLAHDVGVHHARLPGAFVEDARGRGVRAAPVDVDTVERWRSPRLTRQSTPTITGSDSS